MARDTLRRQGIQTIAGVISPVSDAYGKKVGYLIKDVECYIVTNDYCFNISQTRILYFLIGFSSGQSSLCYGRVGVTIFRLD